MREDCSAEEIAEKLDDIADCYNDLSNWIVDNVSGDSEVDCYFMHLGGIRNYGVPKLSNLLSWAGIKYEDEVVERILEEFPLMSRFDKTLLQCHSAAVRAAVNNATEEYKRVVKLYREGWAS